VAHHLFNISRVGELSSRPQRYLVPVPSFYIGLLPISLTEPPISLLIGPSLFISICFSALSTVFSHRILFLFTSLSS
jgi:hypothetical protein